MKWSLNRLVVCLALVCMMAGVLDAAIFRPGALLRSARENISSGDCLTAAMQADSVLARSSNALVRIEAVDLLSKAYTELGMINKAADAYQKGMEIFSEPGFISNPDSLKFDPDYRRFVFNYGQFMLSTGRFDECLALIDGIEFPEGSDEDLRLQGLKAGVLTRKGDTEGALSIYDSALSDTYDLQSPTVVALLQNRGYLNLLSRNFKAASEDLKAAMENAQGRKKEASRANLALAYSGMGNYDLALATVNQALANLKSLAGENDQDYIIALRKKGEILSAAGKHKDAVKIFREFYRLEKERLHQLLPQMSATTRLNYWTMEKPLLSRCFLAGEADPSFALDVALMRRETSLMGSRFSNDVSRRLSFDSHDLKALLNRGEATVAFVSYPDSQDTVRYAAITLDSKGKSSFIPLFTENMVYAPYGGTVSSIYDHIVSEDPRQKNRLYTDSILGAMIWEPIITTLPKDIKTIHFAPEGVFHLWGIENMPFPGKESFHLVRHFSLVDIENKVSVNQSSAAAHLFAGGLDYDDVEAPFSVSADRRQPNREAYSELRRSIEGEGRIFTPLSGTADEVEACAPLMPGSIRVAILTEEDFRNDARSYGSLHLATHGYTLDCGLAQSVLPVDSVGIDLTLFRSGLALTGANALGDTESREDGILSAREICDLDLSEADLVVLSACQTAKGLISDESASGLIRALKMAGAKTIIASLWEVDDRSATVFMANFYEALNRGLGKQEAIEEARMLTAGFARENQKREFDAGAMSGKRTGAPVKSYPYAKPWYWAPFILIDP